MKPMTALQLVKRAGIEPYEPKEAPGLSLRFRRCAHERDIRLQRVLRAASTSPMPSSAALAFAALVNEAVSPIDLSAFLDALNQRWSVNRQTYVDWTSSSSQRLDRRLLGAAMRRQLRVVGEVRADEQIGSLTRWLVAQGYQNNEQLAALWEFGADLILALHRILPMPLWAHAVGLQRLAPLDVDAMIRRETKRIRRRVTEAGAASDLVNGLYLDFLDDAEATTGRSSPPGAIDECLNLLKLDPKLSDQAQRRAWTAAIAKWRGDHQVHHPADLLIIGWICHLLEFGTYAKTNPKAKTVKDYARTLAPTLAAELRATDVDLQFWNLENFRDFYAEVRLVLGGGSGLRAAEGAALLSFHQFIEEHIGGPSAIEVGGFMSESARVKARVVWPHELARAVEWIPHASDDHLLARMVGVALTIAGQGPIRTNELMRLRLADVRRFDSVRGSYLEIAIRPVRGRRELKSSAAARWIEIRCPQAVEVIWGWVLDRRACAYLSSDRLFGDPKEPKTTYRKRRLVDLAHRMLRAATGEADARFHDLRHAFVSIQIESVLMTERFRGPDRLAELSVRTGHAHPSTTLVHYAHLFEAPLRMWLDIWQNSYASTPTAKREPDPSQEQPEQSAYDGDWGEPTPPLPQLKAKAGVKLQDVLLLLAVGQPVDVEATARRFGFEGRQLHQIQTELEIWCLRQGRHLRSASTVKPKLPIPQLLKNLGLDPKRAQHTKYDALREFLQTGSRETLELVSALYQDWPYIWQQEYVVLSEPERVRSLWALLARSRVQPNHLQICCPTNRTPDEQAALLQLLEDAFKIFRTPLETVELSPRRGRPPLYLRWLSKLPADGKSITQGSGTSVEGLIGLIGATCIWFLLTARGVGQELTP